MVVGSGRGESGGTEFSSARGGEAFLPADEAARGKGTSMVTTGILLAASGIGSGMLTTPAAVTSLGPVLAILVILIIFVLSTISTIAILLGSARLNANTYGVVIDKSLRYEMTIFGLPLVDTIFCFYLVACNIGFLDFLGDFIPEIMHLIPGMHWFGRALAIFISGGVVASLTLSNTMGFLSRLAEFGIVSILYTACVVVVESATKIPARGDAVSEVWSAPIEFTWAGLQSCGNIFFAFCIGSNVPAIAVEMEDPTLLRAVKASLIGNGIMLAFYMTLGLTCYLSFVGEIDPETHEVGVKSDFTESYGKHDPFMSVSRGLLSVNMITAGALTFVPALKSFYIVVSRLQNPPTDPDNPPFLTRALSVSCLSMLCALAAYFMPDVKTFISWLGSFFGAPELLLAPWIIMIWGVVGAFGKGGRIGITIATGALMLFFWTAAVTDCVRG